MKWSMRPITASGGEEAIEILRRQRDSGDPIRLMLLDCQMPGMDGFETAARVYDDAGTGGADDYVAFGGQSRRCRPPAAQRNSGRISTNRCGRRNC